MARIDLRVRVLGRALGLTSISRMDDEQIARAQQRHVGHNRVLDLLLGGVASGVKLRDDTAAGATGPLPVRVYRPAGAGEGALPLVVNVHGGGWVLGALDQSDWLCSNVAAAVHCVVVSVGYRLAPAHRWPAAAEDCYAALVDIAGRADDWFADRQRLAVMGDSAGGNLAAVVSLMARDRSGPPIRVQALLYPATDLTCSSPSIDENADAPILTRDDVMAFPGALLGGRGSAPAVCLPLAGCRPPRLAAGPGPGGRA